MRGRLDYKLIPNGRMEDKEKKLKTYDTNYQFNWLQYIFL